MAHGLFEEMCGWPNLWQAWRKASSGKRRKPGVASFEARLEENLSQLGEELRSGTWRPGAHVSFHIHEPKRRLISSAPFRDRVAHHALCNVTVPLLERSFVADSFANRVGYGTHRALDACQRHARRHRYCLAMDVQQFFPSVDHEILMGLIRRRVRDERVLAMAGHVLAGGAGVFEGRSRPFYGEDDDLFAALRPRGLPIGNLTSQVWANVYLTPLDHFVKRELRCPGYVRYVDDFRLFGDDPREMWSWRDRVAERLATFRLRVHPRSQPRGVEEGVPFLGFRVWPARRRVKARKVHHAGRRLRLMARQVRDRAVPASKLTEAVVAWVNHVSRANTIGLRKCVLRGLWEQPPS
jgi:retron-type reverse transcriptase